MDRVRSRDRAGFLREVGADTVERHSRPADDYLVRRLFLSALALVYLIAFVSLWVQVRGLIGDQGIAPAADFLATAERQLGASRFALVPTLAWVTGAHDPSLQLLCAAGTLASLLLLVGVAPSITSVVLWATYLSLVSIAGVFLRFQWDSLLLEAGFLSIFYAPPLAWGPTSAGWRARPSRVATWLLRLLLFKLMFLSGVVKLSGGDPTWRNLTALTVHYETTCLPTWTGWYLHQMPAWFHQISAASMFAVELAVPFLIFGPRRARVAAAIAFSGLMFFIAVTGNYGFFNLLSLVLCIPLLDDGLLPGRRRALAVPAGMPRAGAPGRSWPVPVMVSLASLVVVLTAVPFARALRVRVDWPRPVAWLYELQAPFEIVNGYGLFANMTTERPEIIVEGSRDGRTWLAYEFRWKPCDPKRPPGFVQPHMPRLDWQMWFAALGSVQNQRWFLAFCLRLLQGSPAVLALLEENPFPDRPPHYLRATLYDYRFTTWSEQPESGAWWRRREIRPYTPVLALAPGQPDRLLAAPDVESKTEEAKPE